MVRIDLLNTDTSAFGFVSDELLEVVEVPRVDTRPRTVLADAFEVFYPNDGILELFGERDETTGEFVIQVFDSTLFFVTHTFTCAKRARLRKRTRVGNDICVEHTSPHHLTPALIRLRHRL